MEGLKRAQRFRLEDQRGTEINFELPDFLKDNKLKSIKSPEHSESNGDNQRKAFGKAPQPAPRLSISRNNNTLNNECTTRFDSSNGSSDKSPRKTGESPKKDESLRNDSDGCYNDSTLQRINGTLPPPLPPKPRIKPTTWTNGDDNANASINETQNHVSSGMRHVKGPIAERINMLTSAATEKKMPQPRTIYFDQLNSSFV